MITLLVTIFYAAAETAPLTEEELAELADLAIVGEVVASECDSIAETEQAIVRTYTAEIEIAEVLVGEAEGGSIVIQSRNEELFEPPDSCGGWSPGPHPVGELATYYLAATDTDGIYTEYKDGVFYADTSDPQDTPECPELENAPVEEDELEDDQKEETGGCSLLPLSTSIALWLALPAVALRRRS